MKTSKRTPKVHPWIKAINDAKKQFLSISKNKLAWERESLFAAIQIEQNQDTAVLRVCDPASITQAVVNAALTGVSLNPMLKEAYFAARDGKCTLEFSYRGLISIATSEGSISAINANVVYEWDEFSFCQGTNARVEYRMSLNPPIDPGEIARDSRHIWEKAKAAYSMATLPNGQRDFIVLPLWKLRKIWQTTGACSNPINQAWPEEWLKKTAIRAHSKTLPHAVKLVTAVSLMNEVEGANKGKGKPESEFLKRIKNGKKKKQ